MQYVIFVIAFALLIVFAVVLFDSNRFIVKTYEFTSEKILKDATFVFVSDLHNKEYGKQNKKLLRAVRDISPDAVLLGGDILTAKKGESFDKASEFVKRIAEEFQVYYANGNHEFRIRIYPDKYGQMSELYEKSIQSPKITRLMNQTMLVPELNVKISGLEIGAQYYKKFEKKKMESEYVETLLGKNDLNCFHILMAHNPEFFSQYAEYGADLILSGHVHGGVAVMPCFGGVISPSLRLFPKYDGGLFRENGVAMVLSRGLGAHTIPVRFLNPGELVVIRLHAQK